jgi:hypothetical protein
MTTGPAGRPGLRTASSLLAVWFLLVLAAPASRGVQGTDTASSLSRNRSIAASQHEIVMILIGKREYAKAVSEAGRIFELNWPAEQEDTLLKELLAISARLHKENQPGLGLQLVEKNSRMFKSRESRIAILKEKGFLYKELGDHDKALESFKEARTLDTQGRP